MKELLLVALGGGTGALLRYIFSSVLQIKYGFKHWGTFWVNVSGCFLLGLLSGLSPNSTYYTFFIIGIIGSYTTFSTFEYENIDLIAHEKYSEFIKYTVFSCFISFAALILGTAVLKNSIN